MNADFLDAHNRHMDDGELLYQESRLANADQFYGFAAECGLKKLMSVFGMFVTTDGSPTNRVDRVHADEIWARYETYRSTSVHGANYALPSSYSFQNWRASQRYVNRNDILRQNVEAHRAAAGAIRALVKQAQLEGLI